MKNKVKYQINHNNLINNKLMKIMTIYSLHKIKIIKIT